MPTDDDIRDAAAIEALLAPYRGLRSVERPDDPRRLDPERLRALRARLVDEYGYRWRATDANGELVEALYGAVKQTNDMRYALCTGTILLDEQGHSPGPGRGLNDERYRRYHYITVCSQRVRAFLTSYADAVALQRSLLPEWGVTVRDWPGGTVSVRLENGRGHEGWVAGGSAPLLIVVATLDHLIAHPDAAAPWRSI